MVTLSDRSDQRSRRTRSIVDTGADGCIAPSHVLRQRRLRSVGDVRVRGQWDRGRATHVYRVDLGIGNLRLPSVEIAADEHGDELILGRNVLNKLMLILDGPRQRLEVGE